ncbi:DUF1254 domain-containing protein [Clostridium sp.]|uniref:DUF1254 domain-containing protein n=1 Tax=Clostridium sp. TaxID=1506 RepID=UPI003F2B847E
MDNIEDKISYPCSPSKYHAKSKECSYSQAISTFIYGYPLVLSEIVRLDGLGSLAQRNKFAFEKTFVTPKYNRVIRPNIDTLYGSAWLNLKKGPLLLHVPDTNNRYYVAEVLDAWSNVFQSIGSRTTGNTEQNFIIIGPDTNVYKYTFPKNTKVIKSPTNIAWIILRIQTNGSKDYDVVHKLQEKFTISALYKEPINPQIKSLLEDPIFISNNTTNDEVNNMLPSIFINILMQSMYKNPPYAEIQSCKMNNILNDLNLIPSPIFSFSNLNDHEQGALKAASKTYLEVINTSREELFNYNKRNGWSYLLSGIGTYGTDYLTRAIIATTVYGANIPKDSIYAFAYTDNNNKPLNGNNKYKIHFESNPPVNAFWSITLYNEEGFLVQNTLNKYSISPHIESLNLNDDGSFDVYLQHSPPVKNLYNNWLPTPMNDFNLMLRLYWPSEDILSGKWLPPKITII